MDVFDWQYNVVFCFYVVNAVLDVEVPANLKAGKAAEVEAQRKRKRIKEVEGLIEQLSEHEAKVFLSGQADQLI